MIPAIMLPSGHIACLECDLLLPTPVLAEGERAACPRCGHQLASHPRDGLDRSLAFAMGAAVFLVIGCMFPLMSMKAGGFENAMTLPQSALELYYNGRTTLALLVAAFIILVPAVLLGSILALLVPLTRGRNAPWLVPAGRLIFTLSPWSMVEVFVIGVIVSLVKLAAMATIVLGISFWSYVAFSLSLTAALSSLDRFYVWGAVEQVSSG
jgi:paraquat-inducible protein A